LLTVPIAGCSPERAWRSALVLADIGAGSGPSRLKRTTPEPHRERIAFPVGDQTREGDLYRTVETPRAALLLVPGAAERGSDDPRLVALATTLARARFAVLVPDLPSLRRLQVQPGNVEEIAGACRWLLARPELAPSGRLGIMAFSYAAGPAVLAALKPGLRSRVALIFAVGGYYDLPEVLVFFATGWFRRDGHWCHMEPNAYGKWVFVRSNLERIDDPRDRERFAGMAARKLADPAAGIADLAAGLSPGGRDLYAFLTSRDPAEAAALLEKLPPGIRADIAALDLARRDLASLRARLVLVHGKDDRIIPYPQSLALARALAPGQADVFLVKGLFHVDLEPGFWSKVRLWRSIMELLALQELEPAAGDHGAGWYNGRRAGTDPAAPTAKGGHPMAMEIDSSAFRDGQAIPEKFTCDGADRSPPLSWSGVPEGTGSLALIVDDPDAPGGTFVHWVLFNLPAASTDLPAGVEGQKVRADGSRQGRNGFGNIGYGGPCPPGGTHRYYFKLYALDTLLELGAGAGKQDLLEAMEGHVLAEGQLMGTYRR